MNIDPRKSYFGQIVEGVRVVVVAHDTDHGFRSYVLRNRSTLRDDTELPFEWGNASAGTEQLALSLLADLTGDDEFAQSFHREFREIAFAPLDANRDWHLSAKQLAGAVDRVIDEALK